MEKIKVKSLNFVEKDLIEVSNLSDFDKVRKTLFEGDLVFDLNGRLYLVGMDVAYFVDVGRGEDK